MEKLKENIASILAVAVLFSIVQLGSLYGVLNRYKINNTQPLAGSSYSFLETTRSAAATTTRSYLNSSAGPNASTTAIFKIDRAVDLDLNLVATASTTNSRLVYAFAFSNNYTGTCSTANAVCSTTGNGDWFFEDGTSVDSTTQVTHGSGRVNNPWVLNASSTESCGAMCFTKNVSIPDVRATYLKIYFGSTVADASIWYELMRQVPFSGR